MKTKIKVERFRPDLMSEATILSLESTVQRRTDESWTLRAVYGQRLNDFNVAYLVFSREEKGS